MGGMADKKRASILSQIDSKTKVLALIAMIAEALFLGAITVLPKDQVIYGLVVCAAILLVTIVGIVIVEVTEAHGLGAGRPALKPSPLTPDTHLLNNLINTSIETVCRAVSLPQTPQSAKIRVFIFRREGSELVCRYYWSQDPVKEQVGVLKFQLNSKVGGKIAVVRSVLDGTVCRTEVQVIPEDTEGISGDVSDDLTFVLAAPIKAEGGSVWGTVDFDAATDEGKALLSTEVSNAVMYQLAQHLQIVFSLTASEGDVAK